MVATLCIRSHLTANHFAVGSCIPNDLVVAPYRPPSRQKTLDKHVSLDRHNSEERTRIMAKPGTIST
jgi:hypothetical protein